jgi:hypothetical protein
MNPLQTSDSKRCDSPKTALSKTGLSNATATAPEAGEDVTLPLSSGPIAVSLAEQELLGAWTLTVVDPQSPLSDTVRPTAANRRADRRSDRSLPSSAADAIDGFRAGYRRREAAPAATNF